MPDLRDRSTHWLHVRLRRRGSHQHTSRGTARLRPTTGSGQSAGSCRPGRRSPRWRARPAFDADDRAAGPYLVASGPADWHDNQNNRTILRGGQTHLKSRVKPQSEKYLRSVLAAADTLSCRMRRTRVLLAAISLRVNSPARTISSQGLARLVLTPNLGTPLNVSRLFPTPGTFKCPLRPPRRARRSRASVCTAGIGTAWGGIARCRKSANVPLGEVPQIGDDVR